VTDVIPLDNGIGTYLHTPRFHVAEISRVPGISASTRAKLPALQADLDRIRQEVDPCLLSTGTAYDDESLGAYYDRMLGAEASSELQRYWIEPALSWWGWPAYQTSRIALLSWLAQQQAEFVAPRGGIGVLTRKLTSLLPVKLLTSVRYITPPN